MPAFKGKFDFVIVGGGNAAGYAAKEYVSKGGPKGELLIITSEPVCNGDLGLLSVCRLSKPQDLTAICRCSIAHMKGQPAAKPT